MRLFFLTIISISFFFSCTTNEDAAYVPIPNLEIRQFAGGETTVFISSSNAFSTPAPNLSATNLEQHLEGDFQFEQAFVTAPATVNSGVGPIFNNVSCIACHVKDGRAAFPKENSNALSGFFLRTSMPGVTENGGPVPVPDFGLQIQNQAIFGVLPEAKFQVNYTPITEVFADGTSVILQKPNYQLVNTYKPLPNTVLLSPRIAPPVFGLGLLEAVFEATILANEDINDTNNDGISGKANYVYDSTTGTTTIGRFGWKANTATILEQCATAYVNDMGITNPMFTQETGFGQTNGEDGLLDDPEISQEILESVTLYCQTLAVPAARNLDTESVQKGAQIFENIQCGACHIPSLQTGSSAISALENQTIYAYTDLLLHDMGEGLADNRPDFLATGSEWKTRPLWGIGLTKAVNGHTQFLHDGRANNLTEAILWHGGEAQNSKNLFKSLSLQERKYLLAFLNAL